MIWGYHYLCRVANSFFTTMLRNGVLMSFSSRVGTDEERSLGGLMTWSSNQDPDYVLYVGGFYYRFYIGIK